MRFHIKSQLNRAEMQLLELCAPYSVFMACYNRYERFVEGVGGTNIECEGTGPRHP